MTRFSLIALNFFFSFNALPYSLEELLADDDDDAALAHGGSILIYDLGPNDLEDDDDFDTDYQEDSDGWAEFLEATCGGMAGDSEHNDVCHAAAPHECFCPACEQRREEEAWENYNDDFDDYDDRVLDSRAEAFESKFYFQRGEQRV